MPAQLTDSGRRLLRRLADAGILGLATGPSTGQAAAKLVRDGYARYSGQWCDLVVITDEGREALARSSPR